MRLISTAFNGSKVNRMLQYSDKDKKRWGRGWWPLALSVIIGSFKVAIEIFQWFDLRGGGISVLLAIWFFRCNDGGMWGATH